MSYGGVFAAFYDQLTQDIDYPARARYFDRLIRRNIQVTSQTILLDLACGTGSLSAAFSSLRYDVIGVDGSADMLAQAMGKQPDEGRPILFLRQPLEQLDLFGTVDVTVCALDSINHITEIGLLQCIFDKVSLFTAPGGLFLFDVNTEYKHREILADYTFVYDLDDVYCVWQNRTDEALCTEISMDFFVREKNRYKRYEEHFCERAYSQVQLEMLLEKSGFRLVDIFAGDTEHPLLPDSQRAVYVAQKI